MNDDIADDGDLHGGSDRARIDDAMDPEEQARVDLGRRLKAAREYAGFSRKQLGKAVGRSSEQIARYERAEGAAPGKAIIEATARRCLVPVWFINEGFGIVDPATSFSRAAHEEARRRREHPDSKPEDHPGGDAGDGGS